MRAPEFWTRDGALPRLLSPLAALWAWQSARRLATAEPFRAAVPVVCVGNVVAGGAGKTPTVLALVRWFAARGRAVHVLTRGHGGTEVGPRQVDPVRHNAGRVGDEALLLAQAAPTWVARWRPDGAVAATAMGAELLIMDDGFQNPGLAKDLSLVVVDGGYGFGNGRVMPAGPCREPVDRALARADAAVLIGEDRTGAAGRLVGLPLLRARLVPGPEAAGFAGRRVVAFAGIGRPEKFFTTLRAVGADLVDAVAFADHHPYTAAEIASLAERAQAAGALLATTAKDAVRVPEVLRPGLAVLTVTLEWDAPAALGRLLERVG